MPGNRLTTRVSRVAVPYVVKRIHGRLYVYRQFRVGKKVVSVYIAPFDRIVDFYIEHHDRITEDDGAGAGIRTREGLRQRILSPPPLSWLGHPR